MKKFAEANIIGVNNVALRVSSCWGETSNGEGGKGKEMTRKGSKWKDKGNKGRHGKKKGKGKGNGK